MKFKVESINELSDSRQLIEAKPHKFISIFIYILLSLIFIFLLWSWFSEKEVVVKVSGIIKSDDKSYTISNTIDGEVKEVNIENGQDIKLGQVLYQIDDSNLKEQKNKLENQKENLIKEIKKLDKFEKSIINDTNYFSNSEDEKEYYYKYKNYETNNKTSILDKTNLMYSKDDMKKLDEEIHLIKEKNKSTLLSQIYEKINSNNEKLKELKYSIQEINQNIEKCKIKSTVDGELDIKTTLEPGMILQSGTLVASVLPKEKNYKVELIIPDKDIANIKTEQQVKYNITSLPYTEYGFLKGNIKNLGVDSQADSEKGFVFYKGEGTLECSTLYNDKREKHQIKPGMTCEAIVITKEKKMLYYLLEKLNLKK